MNNETVFSRKRRAAPSLLDPRGGRLPQRGGLGARMRNKRRAAPSVSHPLGGRTTYVVGLGALRGTRWPAGSALSARTALAPPAERALCRPSNAAQPAVDCPAVDYPALAGGAGNGGMVFNAVGRNTVR
jgi:hypothetical protein